MMLNGKKTRKYYRIMEKLLDFYNDNEDYISILCNDSDDIKEIYELLKSDREYLQISIRDFNMHDC